MVVVRMTIVTRSRRLLGRIRDQLSNVSLRRLATREVLFAGNGYCQIFRNFLVLCDHTLTNRTSLVCKYSNASHGQNRNRKESHDILEAIEKRV